MIYVDSSVALAQLLGEDRAPPREFWLQESVVASRLLEYEVWNRINSRGLRASHASDTRSLLDGIGLVELVPAVFERALEPFPIPVRTLEGLHLATVEFLRELGHELALATYDHRMAGAARSMGIALAAL
jgi:hypothetical protein